MDMQECRKKMGSNIKKYRMQAAMTQETLAEIINRSPSHVNKIENGHTMPSLETILLIADALGVGLDRLFSDRLMNKEDAFVSTLLDYQREFTDKQQNTVHYLLTAIFDVLKEGNILK